MKTAKLALVAIVMIAFPPPAGPTRIQAAQMDGAQASGNPRRNLDPSPTKDKCEQVANAFWSGKAKICVCNAGYRWNTQKTQCLK
jgi:hypothetical protein